MELLPTPAVWFLVCVVGQYVELTCCSLRTSLVTALLTSYNPKIRPYCSGGQKTNLTLDVAVRQLVDVNEVDQSIRISLWIRMFWNDCHLTWDPANYGNITSLVLPFSQFWSPDLTLYDSVSSEFFGFASSRASISHDGSVLYIFPSTQEIPCELNVKNFPFDEQACDLKFGSWIYHGNEIDILYKNPYADISDYLSNVEWNIRSVTAKRTVLYYGCCPDPYPDVTYILALERKPAFYVINLLVPSSLLTVLAVLSFVLPVDSGEKIGFTITLMLSLAVFQLLLIDTMPPSAENLPLIAVYFGLAVFLVAVACISATISINLYYKGDKPVPPWMRRVFAVKLATIFGLCRRKKRKQVKVVQVSPAETGENESSEKKDEPEEGAENLSLAEEWRLISSVVERLGLAVFLSGYLISSLTIIVLLQM